MKKNIQSAKEKKKIIVAITGASGSIYGVKLIQALLMFGYDIHLVVSPAGYQVLDYEMQIKGPTELKEALRFPKLPGEILIHEHHDIASAIASGSFRTQGMIVSPCSMGTLAAISQGLAQNLITRSADVCLKERRTLILVVRETPLNAIHLEHMLKLSRLGVTILPAMPAFYHHPQTIDDLVDFITGRTLDAFGIENQLYRRYQQTD